MNQIDRIKAELKRRIEVERINKANGYPECDGAIVAYQGMLDFVNSLSYKTENDDEFEAYFEIYNKEYSKGEYCHETSFKWGFEEGSRWKREQMMKDAVECNYRKGLLASGHYLHDLTMADFSELAKVADRLQLCDNDKVKVIIIKE